MRSGAAPPPQAASPLPAPPPAAPSPLPAAASTCRLPRGDGRGECGGRGRDGEGLGDFAARKWRSTCMYVCMHACVYARMHACMHAHVYLYAAHVSMYAVQAKFHLVRRHDGIAPREQHGCGTRQLVDVYHQLRAPWSSSRRLNVSKQIEGVEERRVEGRCRRGLGPRDGQ